MSQHDDDRLVFFILVIKNFTLKTPCKAFLNNIAFVNLNTCIQTAYLHDHVRRNSKYEICTSGVHVCDSWRQRQQRGANGLHLEPAPVYLQFIYICVYLKYLFSSVLYVAKEAGVYITILIKYVSRLQVTIVDCTKVFDNAHLTMIQPEI